MSLPLFYGKLESDQSAVLNESETRHCLKVLRKKVGDEIHFSDGKGKRYLGIIRGSSKRGAVVEVVDLLETRELPSVKITLAFAPTKSSNRFEWLIEKAVEIGVYQIVPFVSKHSERKKINTRRAGDIALSAMKQSDRLFLPAIKPLRPLVELIDEGGKPEGRTHLVATQGAEESICALGGSPPEVVVYIGPEGDFSESEMDLMHQNDFKFVTLGNYRLRTETAGVVAVTQLNSIFQ